MTRHFAPRPAVGKRDTQQGLPQTGPCPQSLGPRGPPLRLSPGLACFGGPTGLGEPLFGTGGPPGPSRLAPKCLSGKVHLTLSKAVPGGLSLLQGFLCLSVGCLVAKLLLLLLRFGSWGHCTA